MPQSCKQARSEIETKSISVKNGFRGRCITVEGSFFLRNMPVVELSEERLATFNRFLDIIHTRAGILDDLEQHGVNKILYQTDIKATHKGDDDATSQSADTSSGKTPKQRAKKPYDGRTQPTNFDEANIFADLHGLPAGDPNKKTQHVKDMKERHRQHKATGSLMSSKE